MKGKYYVLYQTYLWEVIFVLGNDSQRINFVSFVFRKRDIFDIPSFSLLFEANKYLGVLGNIVIFVSSNLMAVGVCLDCPVVVKFVET